MVDFAPPRIDVLQSDPDAKHGRKHLLSVFEGMMRSLIEIYQSAEPCDSSSSSHTMTEASLRTWMVSKNTVRYVILRIILHG